MHELLSGTGPRQWFAVQVWAGREQLCARHLQSRNYEVFLPSRPERRRWSDRVRTVEQPLFPGYVFCRAESTVTGRIVTTPGAIRILGSPYPAPVPVHEIEAIRRVVAAGLFTEPWQFVQTGQRVRIAQGPLRDTEGIVVTVKNRHRLIVSIDVLRRSVAVEIDAAWITTSSLPSLV
jgi:transcription termination/antitermination protein NusG